MDLIAALVALLIAIVVLAWIDRHPVEKQAPRVHQPASWHWWQQWRHR